MIKTKTVIITVWDCGIEAHAHKTKAVAEKCALKQSGRTKAEIMAATKNRTIKALKLLYDGVTLTEAGDLLGVSGTNVTRMINTARWRASRIEPSIPSDRYGFAKPLKGNTELLLVSEIIQAAAGADK
jgi:hypothetical protein